MAFTLSLAKENVFHLVAGATTFLMITACLLLPSLYRERELAAERPRIMAKLKEQQQIKELLVGLQGKQKRLEAEAKLGAVSRKPLAASEINSISSTLNEIAAETGFRLLSLQPELENNERKEAKKLRVESELRGQLAELSPLLIKILQLPYVATIRSLSIQAADGGLRIKLTFLVDLA